MLDERKQIAETILAQLGGHRFIAMTGATSFSHGQFKDGAGLSFRLPKTPKGAWTGARIVLLPSDTYSVTFLKLAGSFKKGDMRMIEDEHDGIYADSLREVFTRATGLETSL